MTSGTRKYGPCTLAPRALRVQAPVCLCARVIAPALPRFLHQRPGLCIQLSEIEGGEENLLREADAALCTQAVHDSTLIVQQLAMLRVVTCASPDFIERHGLPETPAELAPRHCIGVLQRGTTAVSEWVFRNGLATWSMVPAAPMTFASTEAAVAAAVRGGGYVHVPSVALDEKRTSGLLQSVLEEWDEEWPVSIVYARDQQPGDDLAAFSAFVAGLLPSGRGEWPELSRTGSG